jgi:hypothetical protein
MSIEKQNLVSSINISVSNNDKLEIKQKDLSKLVAFHRPKIELANF